MATGNGAYVLHKMLEGRIEGYQVHGYDPRWEYFPLAFPFFFRTQKPALIHTTPDYGCLFNRSGIPLVVTAHNLVLDAFMRQYSSRAQRIHYRTDLRLFTRLSLEKAAAVTAVSEFTANMVRDELGFGGPIRVIYNGIDMARFSPGGNNGFRKGVRVLFAGNLTLRKGANLLPAIAARLAPDIEIAYTSGLRGGFPLPDLPNLKNLGRISVEAMPELYRNCDILLFPTVREGFGLAPAEAMACGLPVVATDCSALPELIDNGKGGFLCPLGDVDAFADRIRHLAENPPLRREMGDYNRAKVEKMFTLDRMVSQYKELFEEVLSKRQQTT
jgi:glycosyltransferase involved in cell wall biosynthesis